MRGDDLVTEIPAGRWDADEFYDPEPGVPGRSVSRWGGFIDDVAGFDPEFFGISEREAIAMDPQQRLLLETGWEAMEHAGHTPARMANTTTGVFMGMSHDDYVMVTSDAGALDQAYAFTGTAFSMASGRIAYALGLHGPALTVDTACSSSLLAVHMACRSLHEGESNLAMAGGVMIMLEPRKYVSASGQGMLSPSGRCRSFDAAADGFVRSEGCVVLLLKRLEDAARDGDRVLAVIRGTAANQDGRTDNIATPSLEAQAAVYRTALEVARVDPATVGMVEAHGTGTPVGDPIEYGSLARLYGIDNPCALVSVKTNFGHAESAAGALGLMKAILALQHGVVPQTLHFTRLPDELASIETKLFVPQTNTQWPLDVATPRRAAVSSYGMSGTNVHAILEQAPEQPADEVNDPHAVLPALLFPLSSTSAQELARTAQRMADWIETHAEDVALSDLAYTLARRRAHRSVRAAALATDRGELITRLRDIAAGTGDAPVAEPTVGQDDRGPVWLFSGQGSQWAAMGADLLKTEPVFAATIAEIEPLIAGESSFSVTEAMMSADTVTGIDRVQPTLFAFQVALAATMTSHGVRPGAVIGHSLGEVAAAVVAGALTLEDGIKVICRRSRLCTRIAGVGAMASVELPAQRVHEELAARRIDDVVVAVVASPQSTVIGGTPQTVRDLIAAWEERDVMAREVNVDVASHTPQVDSILDALADVLSDLRPSTPKIPYYSATSYDPREEPVCDTDYWVDNLRHTVRFAAAVQAALEDGYRVFAELSPHPLLIRAVAQTATSLEIPAAALASMRREQHLPHGLLGFVADLHCAGAAIDLAVLAPHGKLVDAPLPTWTHRRLMLSSDGAQHKSAGTHTVTTHPLLGPHVRLLEEPERHAWHSDVGTGTLPWLADHQIHNVAALPGAAYCEMALAAARTMFGDESGVRDLRFEEMLLLDTETLVGAVASVESPGVARFVVETDQDGQRSRCATAVLQALEVPEQPPAYDMTDLKARHPSRIEGSELRQWFDSRGVQFGPGFTGLAAANTTEGPVSTVLAEVGLPSAIRAEQRAYGMHPVLLDACFQSVAAHPAVQNAGGGGLLLPLGVRRLCAYGPTRTAQFCLTRVTSTDGSLVEADLDLLDEHGAVLLSAQGLQMGSGMTDATDGDRLLGERLLAVEWHAKDLPEAKQAPGNWLLISTADVPDLLSSKMVDALKLNEAEVTTMSWPLHADHLTNADRLRKTLIEGGFTGVAVVTQPRNDYPEHQCDVRGRDCVQHMVRIIRQLPDVRDITGHAPRLFVVTRAAQAVLPGDRPNLEQAGLRGLLRVVSAEHPHLAVTQIDVDEHTEADRVANQLLSDCDEDETAWRSGTRHTARLYPSPLRPDERRTTVVNHERDGMALQIRTPGDMQTLELAAVTRVRPANGQIEVAVTASSLNFADVLVAFGRYPTFDKVKPRLGTDFAGVVTAVGPGVTTHRVGDHVGGMSPNGCWATYLTCDANVAVTLPSNLRDDQAAAISTAHATAWHGLYDLARVSSRDKVLIHSATGGVGQAAIAICRAYGAQIFATAGTEERRQALRDMGIEHVYDSRSTAFAEQIRSDTGGYGVDVVLNSLTGAAQRAGVELLAFGGRFVEIGKKDIYGDTRLGLFPFRRNLSFFGVDLGLMCATHPERIRDLLNTVYSLTAEGVLPLPESTHYPLDDAATAIRVMSAAEHHGKLLLTVPRVGHTSVVVPPEQAPMFRSDGAYIVTGGLGGLGLFIASKMASAGCGRIVLNSRSRPNPAALAAIDRLWADGCDIDVVCGDVSNADTVDRLVATATATGLAVRGVLHAAAVVEDSILTNITDELIDRNWAPKVYGAWHLHRATTTQPLDWFCSFSSAAALLGSPGQGPYAAANSWLDAFTHWRRAQGLPASAIAWGAWAQIGRGRHLADGGVTTMITPEEGARAFETLIRHNRAYSGYAPVIGSPWLTSLAQRSRFAEVFSEKGQGRTDSTGLRAQLIELPRDEWPTRVRRLVSEQVSVILRRSVDPDRQLSEYGLDSLGSLELRTRIETETGIRVSSTDITTVRALAEMLCDAFAADAPALSSTGSHPAHHSTNKESTWSL